LLRVTTCFNQLVQPLHQLDCSCGDCRYEEALRGTGWGRRRGWFRDALDKCTTVSQVLISSWIYMTLNASYCKNIR